MVKKKVVYQTIIQSLKARGKLVLADVICYCKMTSFMPLDGVTSFLPLKDVTNTCTHMQRSLTIVGNSSVQHLVESWKKPKTSNVFALFIVC